MTIKKNRKVGLKVSHYTVGEVARSRLAKRLIPLSLVALSGCSMFLDTETNSQTSLSQRELHNLELSIFAARRSLLSRDFERFVVRDSALFQECGSLASRASRLTDDLNETGDSMQDSISMQDSTKDNEKSRLPQLPLGRFSLERKAIEARYLSKPEAYALQQATRRVVSANDENAASSLVTPPDFKNSGLFELTIREGDAPPVVIATSFDTIADSSDPQSSAVQRLYQLLRAFAEDHCGRQAFFGVVKRRN